MPPVRIVGPSGSGSSSIWSSYRPRRYTPLFDPGAQLNSTCNLKFSNLASVMSSGPCPGLTSVPFSTFQLAADPRSLGVHPLRSLPLNNGVGFPHCGALSLFRNGALSPIHCHAVPSGPVVVPASIFPDRLPSKTMSSFLSSSSLGETNVIRPFEISIFGNGRACPQRLTIRALICPSSWVISNHEGYSRSGVFRVKSQRPRKD